VRFSGKRFHRSLSPQPGRAEKGEFYWKSDACVNLSVTPAGSAGGSCC
jgi:hypothetical protein